MVTSTSCLIIFKRGCQWGGGERRWLLAQATTVWGCLQQPHVGFPERDSKPDILWLQNTQVSRAKNNCPRAPATQRWRGRGLFTSGAEAARTLPFKPSDRWVSSCHASHRHLPAPLQLPPDLHLGRHPSQAAALPAEPVSSKDLRGLFGASCKKL